MRPDCLPGGRTRTLLHQIIGIHQTLRYAREAETARPGASSRREKTNPRNAGSAGMKDPPDAVVRDAAERNYRHPGVAAYDGKPHNAEGATTLMAFRREHRRKENRVHAEFSRLRDGASTVGRSGHQRWPEAAKVARPPIRQSGFRDMETVHIQYVGRTGCRNQHVDTIRTRARHDLARQVLRIACITAANDHGTVRRQIRQEWRRVGQTLLIRHHQP